MLFSALSVLALSATLSFASPAARALLDFGPTSGVKRRGDEDYKGEDYQWDDKDCIKGYLKLSTYDGEDYGYVGKKTTNYGAYTKASCDDDKLIVEINEVVGTWGYYLDTRTLNGPDRSEPSLAGIVGFSGTSDDIGKGSYNYFYLGGAAWPTRPEEFPQLITNTFTSWTGFSSNVETIIFSHFDQETKYFDVQWFNSDLSSPETIVGVYEEDKSCALFGTGDKDAFTATFGKATWVKLSFEEKH